MISTDLILEELEFYTSHAIRGNCTPVVFDLFKDSADKVSLIKALGGEPKEEEPIITVEKPESFKNLFKSGKLIRR